MVVRSARHWAVLRAEGSVVLSAVPMADAKAYQKDDELDVVKVDLKDETKAAYLAAKWVSPWGVWELYWVGE